MWKTKVSFFLIIALLHPVMAIESLYAAGVEAQTKSHVDVKSRVEGTNYKAHGAPDPDRVRQTVVNIGIGKNAIVKRSGERLRGTIQDIGVQNFTIRSSKTGQLQVVSFSEVSEIKAKTFPKWAVGAIVAGAVVGVLMGAMLAACGTGGC